MTLPRNQIIGAKVKHISHAKYSEPEFVIGRIGPTSCHSHFITLDSEIGSDIFTAEITNPANFTIDLP